jgi:hypothetical protein
VTNEELMAKAASDSVARIKAADEETLVAAEAFAYGRWDKYFAAKVAQIERRIDEHFGGAGNGATWLADPADLGKPTE